MAHKQYESDETPVKKHYWLYVLKLSQNKYYVGITAQRDPQSRIEQHKHGFYSAQWVKKYGYLATVLTKDLDYVTPAEAEDIENRFTTECMEQYGRGNVRGGEYNYSGKYFYRFGGFIDEEHWKTITVIVLLVLIIVVEEIRWLLR